MGRFPVSLAVFQCNATLHDAAQPTAGYGPLKTPPPGRPVILGDSGGSTARERQVKAKAASEAREMHGSFVAAR